MAGLPQAQACGIGGGGLGRCNTGGGVRDASQNTGGAQCGGVAGLAQAQGLASGGGGGRWAKYGGDVDASHGWG